jgi:hypothetical protein
MRVCHILCSLNLRFMLYLTWVLCVYIYINMLFRCICNLGNKYRLISRHDLVPECASGFSSINKWFFTCYGWYQNLPPDGPNFFQQICKNVINSIMTRFMWNLLIWLHCALDFHWYLIFVPKPSQRFLHLIFNNTNKINFLVMWKPKCQVTEEAHRL